MAGSKPGPAPKPRHLKAIEGNPGHEPKEKLKPGLLLPPAVLDEPDWAQWFPATSSVVVPRKRAKETAAQSREREDLAARRRWELEEAKRARAEASAWWRSKVRIMSRHGMVSDLDDSTLADAAVCWARILQCERDISANGLRQRGERGWQRNGSVTSAKAYRDQFKFYVAQLGLSPVARDGFAPTGGGEGDDDGESPFDV